MVENNRLLPNHQFGFRQRHSTIEQTHRIVQRINEALENKQYCSAEFFDISQAFDKVWHSGPLYKFVNLRCLDRLRFRKVETVFLIKFLD
jgi:hypothetical protein